MIRLAPQDVREQLRVSLLVAPPSLRSAFAGGPVERQAAVDRLAGMLADGLARLDLYRDDVADAVAPAPTLPLFDEVPAVGSTAASMGDFGDLSAGVGFVSAAPALRQPFGKWLRAQSGREGWVGDLGRAAQGDARFPVQGDVDAARKWLDSLRASGDDYEALADAELDWLAL